MKHKPSKRQTFPAQAINHSAQEAAYAVRKFEGMRKQLALVEQTAKGVFAARNEPMPTTPLALVVLLALMWHAVGKSYGSPETLNVGWLCEMMRVGVLRPSSAWPATPEGMVAAYSELDPEWTRTRPQKGWGPRLEPAPDVEKAIQAIITGLNARLCSDPPSQTCGEEKISILSLSEEAQLVYFSAYHHAGGVVIGMHLGERLVRVGLVPGVESEDGAWWDFSSIIPTGNPHVLGILMAGRIAEMLLFDQDLDDSAVRDNVFEDAEVRACAYDLALPDGGSDEAKVLAALEQCYVVTHKMVLDNKLAINTLARLLMLKRWASEPQCSKIINAAKSHQL